MTEKDKGAHLFTSILEPDETILWLFDPPRFRWNTMRPNLPIRRFYVVAIGLPALAIIVACIVAGQTDLIPMLGLASLVALGLSLGPGLVEIGLLGVFNTMRQPPQKEAFAVTSQRILQQRGTQIHTLSLENVPSIAVFGTGTLSFGAVFPMWSGVKDVKQVKAIIEQAQKDRLKAMQK